MQYIKYISKHENKNMKFGANNIIRYKFIENARSTHTHYRIIPPQIIMTQHKPIQRIYVELVALLASE
jgi:hypothetical protein